MYTSRRARTTLRARPRPPCAPSSATSSPAASCVTSVSHIVLRRSYVHDVYEQAGEDDAPCAPAPAVRSFLGDLEPGSLVCDVGCGNGKYLSVNPSVFAVGGDRCTRLAAQAQHDNNEVVVCDNLSLPFRDESFDAVLSIAVVHHFATVERRAMALRELARITRIGGRLLLTVWAMEHEGRNFHSQDVLIPWHRPATLCPPPPAPRFLSVDYDHCSEPWKSRDGSPGSSSLSSPNETCYSFVRRALQRLAGRRSFLPSWGVNTRVIQRPSQRPEPAAADLPIELRRLDEVLPPRLISQPSESSTMKSRSLTDIADIEHRALVRSRSSLPSLGGEENEPPALEQPVQPVIEPRKKPRLVKQKKSINEDDADEDLDKPTDMKSMVEEMPNFKIHTQKLQSKKPGVFKQTSLNEELMSVERLREKERLRKNIQKQASLNEEYLYRRPGALDSLRDSIFSTSATTAKKFQSLKNGLTNKFKTSTTNIDKVTVFVRMLQGWKNHGPVPEVPTPSDNNANSDKGYPERRHSREDGSDSSKDSSLQSDTSVDSEDSFASVIYVPKADGSGDPLSPTPLSPGPTSPRLKVPSVPTSPRMKNSPGLPSPRIKQAFPLIRPPGSPNAVTAPGTVHNKILVAQYSLKNYTTTNNVCVAPIKPQSKSQPNSPPKPEPEINIMDTEIPAIVNKPPPIEIFPQEIDPIPPIKEEEETPNEETKELLAEINKDIEEIHKLTADTDDLKPRVLQDVKPYPKITLQTVAELPEIPQFKPKAPSKSPTNDTLDSKSADRKRKERIRQIKEMLNKGIPPISISRRQHFPIVRSTSKAEPIAKSHPKLMSLELFNPATDDVDSDSSGVSSPDSVDSVISVVPDELRKIAMEKDLPNPPTTEVKTTDNSNTNEKQAFTLTTPQTLIEAVAEVAQSLDETCETVIQSSPRSKRRHTEKLESGEAIAIVQGASSSSSSSNWSLNKLSPGDLRILEDRSRSQSHTSSSGSSCSLERLSPGRRSKDRSPKQGSTSNSTWSLNRLSPNRPEGRSLDENLSKSHRSPTRHPYDSLSVSSTDSEKSISKSESFNRIQNEPLVTCKSDMVSKEEEWITDQQERSHHLTEFAEKLSEKLLQEIDQYSKRINEDDFDLPSSSSSEKSISLRLKREEEDRNTQKILDELSNSLQHLEDPHNKLNLESHITSKLTGEKIKYITSIQDTQESDINKLFPKCSTKTKSKKRSKDVDPIINKYRELKKTMKVTSEEDIYLNNCANIQYNVKPITDEKLPDIDTKNPDDDSAISSSNGNPEITIESGNYDTSQSLETGYSLESEISVDSLCTSTDKRSSLKVGQSTDSSDLDKMEISPESVTSRSSTSTAPLKSGFSIESSDTSAGSDWSRRDKTGSTASLGCVSLASLPSCSECSKERKLMETRSSSEDTAPVPAVAARAIPHAPLLPSLSDGSDSLPSEGGAVTYHRYYHVFKKGELDQLIEKYVESLHVVSSYYDQASWCVIAEKVQVWTI
ncbi:protein piccolo isoform X1 [Maniola jurtina]|uniref:protein piccolo isoform X1 n=1 Tax=Maniola jurtina TaxID=191418 RepID=UPI001E68C10A|nr:protein piccolo isoform X1 [Maniola jurtina]